MVPAITVPVTVTLRLSRAGPGAAGGTWARQGTEPRGSAVIYSESGPSLPVSDSEFKFTQFSVTPSQADDLSETGHGTQKSYLTSLPV